jgi:hypothetical protein
MTNARDIGVADLEVLAIEKRQRHAIQGFAKRPGYSIVEEFYDRRWALLRFPLVLQCRRISSGQMRTSSFALLRVCYSLQTCEHLTASASGP